MSTRITEIKLIIIKDLAGKFYKRYLILINHVHDRTMIYLYLQIESNQCKDFQK